MRARRHLREHGRQFQVHVPSGIHRKLVRADHQRVRSRSVSQEHLLLVPGQGWNFPVRVPPRWENLKNLNVTKMNR